MKRLHLAVLAALVVAYGLGPMATQILTPAVPFVHRDFGIPMAAAQALISLSFLTIAAMTLVYGPLSDRFGRRPVVLAGTALFCVGSIVAAFAPGAETLILGRMLQAAGSAAGLALTRTIIHDVYGREASGQVLSYLTTAMIFVPMLSPMAGGLLLDHVGWRAIFGVCTAFGVIALSLLALRLPETSRERRPDLGLRQTAGNLGALLRDPAYLGPALFFGCVMAAIFATQAAIPYLLVEVLGRSATEYGAWFAVLCACYVAGNYVGGRWGRRIGPARLIFLSGAGCLAAALGGLAAAGMLAWSPALLFVPGTVLYFSGAVAIAPVQAEAVAAQPRCAGSASGLMSAMQMLTGAVVVQAMGFAHDGTPYPMFVAVTGCSVVALLAMLHARAAHRRAAVAGAAAA